MATSAVRRKSIVQYRKMEAARTRRMRTKRRALVTQIKAEKGCVMCPERHPACLQFHHRDPSLKVAQINRMVLKTRSVEHLLAEIAKCDVLCANCHAKHHWDERLKQQVA